MTSATHRIKDYGPQQFPDRAGLTLWQFERALAEGLIPPPDTTGGRWSATVVDATLERIHEIKEAVGTVPDMGASRAADLLQERFGIPVDPDVLVELDRKGLIPCTGHYKEHPLYDGRALEAFTDQAALEQAQADGQLLTRDQVAEYLRVRASDVDHLVRARWLEPTKWVRSGWQRCRAVPAVPLYRHGDLEVLLHHPAIDWDTVRATPKGRPSPLAHLAAKPACPDARQGRRSGEHPHPLYQQTPREPEELRPSGA